MGVKGVITANQANLTGSIRSAGSIVGNVLIPDRYEHYLGECDVTPKIEGQTLPTQNKVLTSNITIKPIPTYEVANLHGGTTFIIGGDFIES